MLGAPRGAARTLSVQEARDLEPAVYSRAYQAESCWVIV